MPSPASITADCPAALPLPRDRAVFPPVERKRLPSPAGTIIMGFVNPCAGLYFPPPVRPGSGTGKDKPQRRAQPSSLVSDETSRSAAPGRANHSTAPFPRRLMKQTGQRHRKGKPQRRAQPPSPASDETDRAAGPGEEFLPEAGFPIPVPASDETDRAAGLGRADYSTERKTLLPVPAKKRFF